MLIITADDYGYHPSYDRGILEAAAARAIDAVSVMVGRPGLDAAALLRTGVEVGLHLELDEALARARRASLALDRQLRRFAELFDRPPAYLDGHHHCHAGAGAADAVARTALELGLAVRSVDPGHRRLLRRLGVRTPDLLVGRLAGGEPALPPELEGLATAGKAPAGVTEWMVHPGHSDPATASSLDREREEDLRLLLRLAGDEAWRRVRGTHAQALP